MSGSNTTLASLTLVPPLLPLLLRPTNLPPRITATVGITAFAAHALGDAVFVELPSPGTDVAAGEAFGAVESVKSASDIMSPVSGIIVETNQKLADKPSLINKSPEQDGWILKIKVNDASELNGLMEANEYEEYVKK